MLRADFNTVTVQKRAELSTWNAEEIDSQGGSVHEITILMGTRVQVNHIVWLIEKERMSRLLQAKVDHKETTTADLDELSEGIKEVCLVKEGIPYVPSLDIDKLNPDKIV